MTPDGAKSLPTMVRDCMTGTRVQVRVDLRADDVQELLDGTRSSLVLPSVAGHLPPYLAPLAEPGARLLRAAAPLSGAAGRRDLRGRARRGGAGAGRPGAAPPAGRPGRGGPRERADAGAGAYPGVLRQPDRAAEPALLQGASGERARDREPAREPGGRALHRPRPFQPDQRYAGARGGRPPAPAGRRPAPGVLPRAGGRGRPSRRDALDPEVARLGGDEFTVIMPGLEDPEDAGKLARRILSQPGASLPARRPGDLHQRLASASRSIPTTGRTSRRCSCTPTRRCTRRRSRAATATRPTRAR